MKDITTQAWAWLWTVLWFFGLAVFSVLSVLVIIFGGYDLAGLLRSLRIRHGEVQNTDTSPAPPSGTK